VRTTQHWSRPGLETHRIGEGESSRTVSAVIRILIVEDLAAHAELMAWELRRSGLPFETLRVDNEAQLLRALGSFSPDVVLSDHSLPQFSADQVLRVMLRERPLIPVIIVTGSLDEETAADYIKAGAVDYVVKDRLYRIGPAVRRALALRQAQQDALDFQDALRRSEQRFRKLVEHSSGVITLLDAAGRIVYSTQSIRSTLGYTEGERVGSVVFELIHPDDRPQAEALFRQVMAESGIVAHADLRVRHKDGTWRDLELAAVNHLDDPVVSAVVVNYHDITERKRALTEIRVLEEQFRQAQKMEAVGRLAGGVAHDFNNLLTVIISYADLLARDLPEGSAARQDLLEIRKAGAQAASLTSQLLAFSRQQVLAPVVLNLNALLADVRKMLQRLLGEDIELSLRLAPQLGNVRADPGQLQQVIMNLAVNSQDAMPTGGQLTIETADVELSEGYVEAHQTVRPGSYTMLVVTDTGTGMDAETRSRAFEPFFTTKEKGHGTGLGLSTVYGIVQQSGGYVWLYSEPGHGTTFKIYLPRVDEPTGQPLPREMPKTLTGTETILLVEDEAMMRPLVNGILEKRGYRVLVAQNATEALTLARQHDGPIHLLLTDVVMPGNSGPELAARLVASRPETAVLYMSGYTDDATVRHGLLDRGLNYIQKPFTPSALAQKVRQVLSSR
jgi:two-component system cell cycle sensor histidine kinase/response regulator CckA